ncbi:MAG TPA: hypothetical protein VK179_00925 [Bacteroidales bacterium]|nr:hypothetical protein [Bacteroidales bacterium]
MKRNIVLFILLVLYIPQSFCQTIENIDWNIKDKKVEIRYDLASNSKEKIYKIEIYVSLDSGATFKKQELKFVTGDVGKDVKPGKEKKVIWDLSKEFPSFKEGDAVFEIKAIEEINKEKNRELFIGYKGSHTAPFGLIAGISGNPGLYISARCNSNVLTKSDLSVENYLPPNGWFFLPNETERKRLSVTAGLHLKLSNSFYVQPGAGLAYHGALWHMTNSDNDTEWVTLREDSFLAFEAEVSALYRIKQFYLSGGISLYKFKYADVTFGIAYTF